MSQLCLNRMGTVTAHHESFNQCKAKGQRDYEYHVKVICPAKNLDKDKFIIDHAQIDHAIQDVFKNEMSSCEFMAVEMADHVKKLLDKWKVYYTDMYIKIAPVLEPSQPMLAYM